MLTVLSWNMHQRLDSWTHLQSLVTEHGVDAALLQEAKKPAYVPQDWRSHPAPTEDERWRISVPRLCRSGDKIKETQRWFASAVVATGDRDITPREPTALDQAIDSSFACSHPGQFAVGDVDLSNGHRLRLISLYGIWDRMADSRYSYVEATLHRAISDLAVVLQEDSSEYVLIGGDLNLYSYSNGTLEGERGMIVLDRLKSYGLEICGPHRPVNEPRLDGCPCPDLACDHVHTYLYQSNPKNRRHQLDFFFATPALAKHLMRCWADPDPEWFKHSDHRPILATFDL